MTSPWAPGDARAASTGRQHSLAWQVSLVTTTVVAITVLIVGVLSTLGDRAVQQQAKRAALAQRADQIAVAAAGGLDSAAVTRLKNQAGKANIKVARIRTSDGSVLGGLAKDTGDKEEVHTSEEELGVTMPRQPKEGAR